MNISFIGYGSMAQAIAKGLLQHKQYHLTASAPSLNPQIGSDGILRLKDNKEAIKNAEVIIVAVKPGQMAIVLEQIAAFIPPNTLLISVAAGLSLNWFSPYLKPKQALIRTMPNTPASVGLGATPMIANTFVTPEQKIIAESIFSSIGITSWASNESDLDTFTALSGSGPAYVYLFMEALVKAAIAEGLPKHTATQFTLQTMVGAIKLAQDSDLSFQELRTKVTSPGGTTAAALAVLDPQLETLVLTAIQAAKNRSEELGNRN